MPEATHMVMWIMSDRAIPRSFRFMEGFGVHTFRLVNAEGKSTFVKFHWKPKQGLQSVVWNEAVKINGADPDFHRRDLWDAIEPGDFPEWELACSSSTRTSPTRSSSTSSTPPSSSPRRSCRSAIVGRLVLDRIVDNFFAETEQVAFCTQNIVPGIDFTNDPLLQGRNFSYLDTQLKRLGSPNFTHIPINAPKCPFAHFQQDGHMAMHNPKGRANYEPNSWDGAEGGPREDPGDGFAVVPGARAGRQAAASARSCSPTTTARPASSTSARPPIEQKPHRRRVHLRAEQGRARRTSARAWSPPAQHRRGARRRRSPTGLGLDELPEPPTPARPPIEDLAAVAGAEHPRRTGPTASPAARSACSSPTAPTPSSSTRSCDGRRGRGRDARARRAHDRRRRRSATARWRDADQKIDGGPSVLFDAVVVLPSADGAAALAGQARRRATSSPTRSRTPSSSAARRHATAVLDAAGLTTGIDAGMIELADAADVEGFLTRCRDLRFWDRET